MLTNRLRCNSSLVLLSMIVLLGLLLRLNGLERQSLWHDEVTTWNTSNHERVSEVVIARSRGSSSHHPPLYNILIYFVIKYFGESEAALRFPSVVASTLAIPAIYVLTRRIYSDHEGLIAAALMAILWCPIYYAQEARSYAMLVLFAICSTYLWLAVVRQLNQSNVIGVAVAVGYVITAVITSYIHYYGGYLVALQGFAGLLFLIAKPRAVMRFVVLYVLITLAYVPWLLTIDREFFYGYVTGDSTSWIPLTERTSFLRYLRFLFNGSRPLNVIVLVLYSSLFVRTLGSLWQTQPSKRIRSLFSSPGFALTLWLTVPFIGVYLMSLYITPILLFRALLISMPPAYILLARSITRLPLKPHYKMIVACMLLSLFLFNLILWRDYYNRPTKKQIREAVEFVVNADIPDGQALIISYGWHSKYFDYYFRKFQSPERVFITGGTAQEIPRIQQILDSTGRDSRYVWYIYGSRVPEPEVIHFLNHRLSLIDKEQFQATGVWLFENRF